MQAIVDFFVGLFWLVIFVITVLAILALFGYNKLQALAESIRESWSNIGVIARKQASLINQLIDVVKGYQESENLVMLKVSEDVSNASNLGAMYQQAEVVLSSANGLAQKFPELKANQQYQRLIDSIQSCEAELEEARAKYNRSVRHYNTFRSSIPTVFFAPILGFKSAPYLEFEGNRLSMDIGTLRSFSADDNAERLNTILANAGSKLLKVSSKVVDAGKSAAAKVVEGGKMIIEQARSDASDSAKSDSSKNSNSEEE